VVDVDIILLNYMNIYDAVKEIFKQNIDYCLPYNECVDLPNFEYRRPWGKECIGGIFIIDRDKFIQSGMNDESFEGWGREDDARHEKLLKLGLKFERKYGYIIHMNHPMQSNLVETAENNMKILNQLRNDIGDINQI
jgi:predicted glycosyltransferase involved in capsule biosynthesis